MPSQCPDRVQALLDLTHGRNGAAKDSALQALERASYWARGLAGARTRTRYPRRGRVKPLCLAMRTKRSPGFAPRTTPCYSRSGCDTTPWRSARLGSSPGSSTVARFSSTMVHATANGVRPTVVYTREILGQDLTEGAAPPVVAGEGVSWSRRWISSSCVGSKCS